MYTLLSSGYVSNVKTEKGEGAVHLLIPENLSRIGIKLYQFLEKQFSHFFVQDIDGDYQILILSKLEI